MCRLQNMQLVLDDMVSEILGYVKTEQQWKYISRYFRNMGENKYERKYGRKEHRRL